MVVLEAMKMENALPAPVDGTNRPSILRAAIRCRRTTCWRSSADYRQ
ncbi:MAG: hypothetical protein WBV95_07080 [Desulfobacterales bacterium]